MREANELIHGIDLCNTEVMLQSHVHVSVTEVYVHGIATLLQTQDIRGNVLNICSSLRLYSSVT